MTEKASEMKRKKLIVGICLISTALKANTSLEKQNMLFEGETLCWGMIAAGLVGYFYGQYRMHKAYMKSLDIVVENYKKVSESKRAWWRKAQGIVE